MKYGRQPQYFRKWKTTSIILKIEDDLHFFENGIQPQFFENDRQPFFVNRR